MKGSVRKKGNTWYYRITIYVNGKPKYIERKGGSTKAEAEKKLRTAISEYEGTGNIMNNTEMQFEEYMNFWYNDYVLKQLRYNTQMDYKNIIFKHIIPYFRNYKIKAITPMLLQQYLIDKKESGLSKNTLIGHKGLLSIALKMAVYPYQILKENPVQYINMPKYFDTDRVKDSEKIITSNDWKKIIKRFPEPNHFNTILNILYYAALRESECLGLTWSNIDFENKAMLINHQLIQKNLAKRINEYYISPLKTDSSYGNIALGETLVALLKRVYKQQLENKLFYGKYYTNYYVDKNNKIYSLPASEQSKDKKLDFICVRENGELINQGTLKYCARVIHHELGIANFTFHRLRHTHASILISNGANMKAVQERLRHSQISTTLNTYSHLLKETEEITAQLFDSLTNNN